jgi:alkylated DNA repair protein (DNA oxidative demethylase)
MKQHPTIIGHLEPDQQADLLDAILQVVRQAPLFQPVLPRWGTPFSVKMTNCGPLGWVADKSGYRYQSTHPDTGMPWPEMPEQLLRLWGDYADYPHPPEACLINHYGPKAKMGLHQDKDEDDFDAPVLSVSLGDDARFRLGGHKRNDPTESFILHSGDIMILDRDDRLAFHGVDRLYPQTSTLLAAHDKVLPDGGRLNLTLRRVSKP